VKSAPAGKYSTSFTEEICYCTGAELKDFLQGHTELYCSYPPQPDLPRAYHLLPSAVQEARLAAAQGSSESVEHVDSQAGGEAEGEPRPATATAAKKARLAAAQGSSESAECVDSHAEGGAEGEPRRDNSSDQSVELAGALPSVPKGQRQGRKHKAQEVESSRY
jgi:hypothetical protein